MQTGTRRSGRVRWTSLLLKLLEPRDGLIDMIRFLRPKQPLRRPPGKEDPRAALILLHMYRFYPRIILQCRKFVPPEALSYFSLSPQEQLFNKKLIPTKASWEQTIWKGPFDRITPQMGPNSDVPTTPELHSKSDAPLGSKFGAKAEAAENKQASDNHLLFQRFKVVLMP